MLAGIDIDAQFLTFGRALNVQAVERYKEALAAQEALGDKHGAALTMGNLASALQSYGALEEAGPYLQKSLALREELGDELGVAQARALIGTQHSLLSRYTKALEELLRATSS